MRYNIDIIILFFLVHGFINNYHEINQYSGKIFDCKKGEMKLAWYEHGLDEPKPNIPGLQDSFLIVVDTNYKAKNFISFSEDYSRNHPIELDTSKIDWTKYGKKLTAKQKLKKIAKERSLFQLKAESIHKYNNQGQQQVWVINNSKDTITIQMQDWSFICVLQAKAKDGQWYPIQYWRFSSCGNSYYFKHFPPNTANSFITKIPKNGNYKTKLRYKLLGQDRYYYSNEFNGKINYCSFVEDEADFIDKGFRKEPHFKLDSVIKIARNWPY